jgi:hypothetical protein
MAKFSIYKGYIITLLLLASSITFAAESGSYGILKAGPAILKKDGTPISIEKKGSQPGELSRFTNQLVDIGYRVDKSLNKELFKAWRNIFNAPPYTLAEIGGGYRFQLIIPFAIEIKGLGERKMNERGKNLWYLFCSGTFKAFIPLGSRTKLYAMIGKTFQLNTTKHSESLEIDKTIWRDIKKTIWERKPQEQWQSSRTLLGAGIILKLSSRIELDFSLHGYTDRESNDCYFATAVGANYLF